MLLALLEIALAICPGGPAVSRLSKSVPVSRSRVVQHGNHLDLTPENCYPVPYVLVQ